jgi:histidinol-phosphatase (PHP family)
MKVNYHTHTYRCGHASGEDEQYVLAAIEHGYDILGFSDHVFVPGLEKEPGMRGEYSQLGEYCDSINNLKVKYKDKIKILVGFECEYFPELDSYYRELLTSKTVDYLILGQHYLTYNKKHIYEYILSNKASFDKYATLVEEGIKSGLFSVLVHPDLYLGNTPWDAYTYEVAARICKCAKEHNVPLEFNQGAMRRGKTQIGDEYRYRYPVRNFWEVAKMYGNEIIMGVDAHSPKDFNHNINLHVANDLAQEWGLKLSDNIIIKKVK